MMLFPPVSQAVLLTALVLLHICLIDCGRATIVDGAVACSKFQQLSQAHLDANKGSGFVLASFTAASCSHCNKSNDVSREFRKSLDESNITKVKFLVVDMDSKDCADVSKDFSLSSLPAVILMQRGNKHSYYSGPVSAAGMLAYSYKVSQSPFTTVNSISALLDFVVAYDIVIAGFFRGSGDKDELLDFKKAAKSMQLRHNVHFVIVTSGAVVSSATDLNIIKSSPSACIFNNLDIPSQKRDWRKTKTACTTLSDLDGTLADWIGPNALRIIDQISSENSLFYEDAKLPMILMFLNATKDNKALLHEFETAAENLRGLASFAWSDDSDFSARKVTLGVPAHISPAIAINTWAGDKNQYVFPSNLEFSARNIQNWVRSYLSGQLKPKVVVDTAPAIDWGLVQSLTSSKFDVVFDSAIDAVVLFYSTQQRQETDIIALQYKRAAERLRALGVKTMVLYAFDVESNPSIPSSVEFQKLPSICIIPAGKKAPPFTYYHGKGKVRPFMLWLQKSASKPLPFTNDTPDLDEEGRKAYVEQLAQMREAQAKQNAQDL